MYLTQPLHRLARQTPDATSIIDGATRTTWRQTATNVARFAGLLHSLNLRPGEPVAILTRNRPHFLDYLLGTFWAGGAINPINLRWSPAEIGFSLQDSETRILIIEPEFLPLLPAIRPLAPRLAHIIPTPEMTEAAPMEDTHTKGDALAALLYTGGTTGRPKGVMLSHNNLAASALGCLSVPGMVPGPVYLHSAPLFHIGAISGMLLALFSASTHAFLPAFDPIALMATVEQTQAHDIFFVPTMLRMILDHPARETFNLSSLRHIRYGASPMDDTLLDRAMAAFPNAVFSQAYGMTELSPIAAILPPSDHTATARATGRLRTAGQATPTVELRILDPDDTERPCGALGEVAARGPGVMQGYWKRPEETAQALRNGWMHTGDIGHMDAQGYITILDRLKDMIISGGENVYSAEVENILTLHPGVAAAAVIGLPDAHWGETVHAVIIPRDAWAPDAEALRAFCRDKLAGYKIPRSISFTETLPLSPAGKVLKSALRAQQTA